MDQAPSPSPSIVQKLLGVPFIFNLLAVLLNFIPLLIISVAPMKERLKQYFPIRSFLVGGLTNFFLVCHILMVRVKNEQDDSLFVTMMGMVMGFMSAFIWLLHEVASKASKWARFWMVILMSALLCGSGFLLYSMQVQLHLTKDKGWGLYLTLLASLTSLCLNVYPILKAAMIIEVWKKQSQAPVAYVTLCHRQRIQSQMALCKALEPDYPVDGYGLFMCVLNTLDASYFVVYAWYMGNNGTLLWLTSCVTAFFGAVQLLILLHSLSAPLREALDDHARYFTAFLIAMICVLVALIFVPEEYVPAIEE